jgi:hypothetical protein
VDSGFDAGGGTCDGGCLGAGQPCAPDVVPNGGCAPGLICEIGLTGISYFCEGPGGDF